MVFPVVMHGCEDWTIKKAEHWIIEVFFVFCFFFSFIFISWRLIALQYCSGFCHTLTWISHGFTCIPHPDPPSHSLSTQSLWVFPVHQVQALVSFKWDGDLFHPGMVICFTLGMVICFTLDNWSFWTMVLEKTLESLLDCKEIQPVHPK